MTMGIGELANFVVGSSMVLTTGFLYKREKTRKGALKGLIAGVIVMSLIAAVMNYFVLLPLYESVLGFKISMIVDMSRKVNPSIKDVNTLIAYSIIPFNIVKGIVVSLITFLMYKKVSPILHK
jgi:riboflavin transporter FmnP